MKDNANGSAELSEAIRKGRGLFMSVFFFSIFVNLLMLTGPIFMLQVYDRVLGSRSEATLVALVVLVAVLYLIMGILDHARGRILARSGAKFQASMDRRVFEAVLKRSVVPSERSKPASGLRDLESVQRLMSSPALLAVCDMPWVPIFIGAIFIFHPWLGYLALAGGLFLVSVTLMNQLLTRKPVGEANGMAVQADTFAESIRESGEVIQGLGMRGSVLQRWRQYRDRALEAQISSSDLTGTFATTSKTFRFFLQSAMLALGAYLVLQGELTPGAMIAGSILLGRALAPVEQAIAQWPLVIRARAGWKALAELLEKSPQEPERTELPKPKAIMEAQQITVVPPGEQVATLRMVSFRLDPGQALGVIGPSGAGKSTLARAILGIWRPASGKVRLDGASLDNYDPDTLGQHIGYLPQEVSLFNGTIAENIARMSSQPDPAMVVEAAKKAAAHDMILSFPEGYDTVISGGSGRLSGGQKQRIGLARAMYGDPVVLVLDEPNANLDSVGSEALNQAIRQMKKDGKSVIIMAHRPAAIAECDLILYIDQGMRKAFGPRDEVLREQLQNYSQVAQTITKDGQTAPLGAPATGVPAGATPVRPAAPAASAPNPGAPQQPQRATAQAGKVTAQAAAAPGAATRPAAAAAAPKTRPAPAAASTPPAGDTAKPPQPQTKRTLQTSTDGAAPRPATRSTHAEQNIVKKAK